MTRIAVRTQFALGDETLFDGYTLGEEWNGFACPYFTLQQAETLMRYQNAQSQSEFGTDAMFYDATRDAYAVRFPDDPARPADYYVGEDLDTADGRLHVYPIGHSAWIWYEDEASRESDLPPGQAEYFAY